MWERRIEMYGRRKEMRKEREKSSPKSQNFDFELIEFWIEGFGFEKISQIQ